MKAAMICIALALTGCGGVEAEDDPSFNAASVESVPLQGCMMRAVRSNTINTNEHSTDGGRTWLPGACGT